MHWTAIAEACLMAYLLGSIPAGYLAGKICGRDLRKEGSGNIGATNVVRVLGKKWGYPVFAVDFLKGTIAVSFAWLISRGAPQHQRDLLALTAAILTILGHNFPVWLKFQGGKGVATTGGVIVALFPWPVFVTGLVGWNLVFFATRYVSLASLVAALLIPTTCIILFWLHKIGSIFVWTGFAICVLVFWRHRSNLMRLMAGTESRFTKKGKQPPNQPL